MFAPDDLPETLDSSTSLTPAAARTKALRMSSTEKPRRLLMHRATPTVSGMVDDAYQALSMQLHQFRESAHREEWDSAKAGAFGKLVNSLVSLQETERKNTASYALGELSDEELSVLQEQAIGLLSEKSTTR